MNEIPHRGPGRPRKVVDQVTGQTFTEVNQLGNVPSNVPLSSIPQATPEIDGKRRQARNVFGQHRQKLSYEARPGYHRHWFNDVGNRIGDAASAGYTRVLGNDGKPVSRIVGSADGGGALTAFLMEIPQEWYDEDMAEQQAAINAKEEAIRRSQLEANPDDRRYVQQRPDGSPVQSIRRG